MAHSKSTNISEVSVVQPIKAPEKKELVIARATREETIVERVDRKETEIQRVNNAY